MQIFVNYIEIIFYVCVVINNKYMNKPHGNKKYFFEELEKVGDKTTCSPNNKFKKINIYSLNNQIKLYMKEANIQFDFEFIENRNGSVTIVRLT